MGLRTAVWRTSGLLLSVLALFAAPPAQADEIALDNVEVLRDEEGVLLSYTASFELSENVIEALVKGVPLHFAAEAKIFRPRWYWRDRLVAHAERGWRLIYQPLTRKYRVSTGGLNQSYDTLDEALTTLRHSARWKLAEPEQLQDNAEHYLEFSFKLDTTQLPRPMQIGIGGQADWAIAVERTLRFD